MLILRDLNNISIMVRILLAMICGGILGIERGKSNQPAGMRTYMLVCMGAAVIMMTGQYIYVHFGVGDPARLGAQVVSGIGFLGAGSIVSIQTKVKGLTTAAGLWGVASIGLGIGIGFYFCSIFATVVIYLVITKFRNVENAFTGNDTRFQLYIKFESVDMISEFTRKIEFYELFMGDIQFNKKQSGECTIIATIKNPKHKSREEILCLLGKQEGIHSLTLLT